MPWCFRGWASASPSLATAVTDSMITTAADAVAAVADATTPGSPLLLPIADLRLIFAKVAIAVAAAAERDGVADVPHTEPLYQVHEAMWRPLYPSFEPI